MLRQVTLTPTARPGSSTLTCGHTTYPVELHPDTDVALGDLLRRLRPVLVGGTDPSQEMAPADLLRAVWTRLWQALFPATAPAADRDTLARALLHETTPLCLVLPAALAGLPWDVLCDPAHPAGSGFLAHIRPLVRILPGGTPMYPPLRRRCACCCFFPHHPGSPTSAGLMSKASGRWWSMPPALSAKLVCCTYWLKIS